MGFAVALDQCHFGWFDWFIGADRIRINGRPIVVLLVIVVFFLPIFFLHFDYVVLIFGHIEETFLVLSSTCFRSCGVDEC